MRYSSPGFPCQPYRIALTRRHTPQRRQAATSKRPPTKAPRQRPHEAPVRRANTGGPHDRRGRAHGRHPRETHATEELPRSHASVEATRDSERQGSTATETAREAPADVDGSAATERAHATAEATRRSAPHPTTSAGRTMSARAEAPMRAALPTGRTTLRAADAPMGNAPQRRTRRTAGACGRQPSEASPGTQQAPAEVGEGQVVR